MERVLVSPYVGAAVKETQARIPVMVADNILAVIRAERPPNLYDPEICASSGRAAALRPSTGSGSD
jgi:phosphoglycerate dehydrogenase-like enzyme